LITDKICYIHLRHTYPNGQFYVKGGATIAWLVESETGDIIIGRPARCLADNPKNGTVGDVFQKAIGRNVALGHLSMHAPAFVVKREALLALAMTQLRGRLDSWGEVSPDSADTIADVIAAALLAGVESFMASTWYEQVVRAHFRLEEDNRLLMADEAMSLDNLTAEADA
jgi:hypothetical protein